MNVIIKDSTNEEFSLTLSHVSGNPVWQCKENKTLEQVFNQLTEFSLLESELDFNHPLSFYRSPSNPNEYPLIKYIVDLLDCQLIKPTIDDFKNKNKGQDKNIVY